MSRLVDKLKQSSGALPPPMGFHTARQAEKPPSMLIIARVKTDGEGATKSASGADFALLTVNEAGTAAGIQKAAKALKDTPCGCYFDEAGGEAAGLAEAGCDFIVYSPASPVAGLPQDEKTGRVLQTESSMDDGLLRAVNDLPADAVLIADALEETGPLLLHQLMIYRHLTAFIAKPLLVPAAADITETELKALWEAGIDGVVVPAEADLPALREMADRLPPRSARKQQTDVRLPGPAGNRIATEEQEEEEEDE